MPQALRSLVWRKRRDASTRFDTGPDSRASRNSWREQTGTSSWSRRGPKLIRQVLPDTHVTVLPPVFNRHLLDKTFNHRPAATEPQSFPMAIAQPGSAE